MRVDGFSPSGFDRRRFEASLVPPYDLLWHIGVDTGLRISDLLTLRILDLPALSNGFEIVERKTNKTRHVKLTDATARAAYAAMAGRNLHEHIWDSPKKPGQPIARQTAWRAFRRAERLAGIRKHVGTHSARKTFARGLYERSDLETVQETMRHRYPSTSAIYVFNPKSRRRPASGTGGNARLPPQNRKPRLTPPKDPPQVAMIKRIDRIRNWFRKTFTR